MSIVSRSACPGVGSSRARPRPWAGRASRRSAAPCRPCRADRCRRSTRRPPDRSSRSAGSPSACAPCTARRDLADVAEHLRGERLVRVAAQEAVLRCARPGTARVLAEVVDLVLRGCRAARRPASADRRRARFSCASMSLTGMPVTCESARSSLRRARPGLRQVGRPQLDACARRRSRRARARCGRAIGPRGASRRIVRTRLSFATAQVPVAREHLQRPEPQEEHGEDGEREERRASRREARAAASAGTAPRRAGRRAGTGRDARC